MSTYNSLTDRTAAGVLVPPEQSQQIIKATSQQSAALALMKRSQVTTNQNTMLVTSTKPTAYFRTPVDTGLAQTTQFSFDSVVMHIVDVDVLAPFPENVLDDVASGGISLKDEALPELAEAAGVLIDGAIFFGTNKPSAWPSDISTAAAAVTIPAASTTAGYTGNTWKQGASDIKKGGLATDLSKLMRLMRSQGVRPLTSSSAPPSSCARKRRKPASLPARSTRPRAS